MANYDTTNILKESTTQGQLDDKKIKNITNSLDKISLKKYLKILKKNQQTKNVTVNVPVSKKDTYIQELTDLFPGKTIIVKEDPSLLLGIKIETGDEILDLSLKHEFENLLEYINKADNSESVSANVSEENIIKQLENRLSSYSSMNEHEFENIGRVEKNSDGVILASGLSKVAMGELVSFTGEENKNIKGFVLNLTEDIASIILLGSSTSIKEGDIVKRTKTHLSIPVNDELIGRVVDAQGLPLDGKTGIKNGKLMALERIAVGVVDREPVNTPLKTGIKAIDSMIPIGRGQRELIIGDRGIGKTAIAIDTIINQRIFHKSTNSKSEPPKYPGAENQKPVICVYVAIGQKQSSIAQIIETLRENGAMEYTIVVAAPSSAPAALQYLAPYAGSAIAEYFMEKGQDVLIVYDDLTKHAWAYRQLSLVLNRPAGREAYPGDIFYLHSRLLERAVKLNKKNGGGSITALPIIETQASDMSAYIPTNVISITDGQIYLEQSLFNIGIRPAINPGNSVSRVGGAAQTKAIKSVAGKLRLELAQYNSLAAFAQFGSELDDSTLKQLERGKRIVEILNQPQFSPMPESLEIISIWAATSGLLDDIPIEKISDFEKSLHDYFTLHEKQLLIDLDSGEKLSDKTLESLRKSGEQFKKSF